MEGFTFWRSYGDTLRKADPDTVKEVLVAMCDYMFNDEEPDINGVSGLLFEAFRGSLDTSKRKSEAGRMGGEANRSKPKQTEADQKQIEANESKPEALRLITKTKTKAKTNNQDKDKDKEQEGGAGGRQQFIPPSLDEVRQYCDLRNSPVDAFQFYDYYTEGGWRDRDGKQIRNWKQKLITWERKEERWKQNARIDNIDNNGGGIPAAGRPGKRTWTEADIHYDN